MSKSKSTQGKKVSHNTGSWIKNKAKTRASYKKMNFKDVFRNLFCYKYLSGD